MTDDAVEPSRTSAGALLREVVGSNRRFDDRLDTSPDISSREALTVMGRSLRLIAQARQLFACKFFLQLTLMVPGLLLPWLAKIVIDNALQGLPFGTTEVAYPPFMTPILNLLEGKDPLGIMATVAVIYVVMLVTIGARAGTTQANLLQGQDAATQAEDQLSAGSSAGSGLLGLAEFMVSVRLTQTLANRLRTRLFERLARLPMTALGDQRTGDSLFRVLYDVPMAPGLIFQLTFVPFFMLLSGVVNLYLLQYSYGQVAPELVLVAWLTVPAAFLITFPFSGALRRTSQNKRAAGAATTNAMEESMSSVAAVQSLGATKQERERFAARSAESFLRERYSLAVIFTCALIAGAALGVAAIYVTILITDRVIDGTMSAGDFATLMGVYYGIVIPAGYFGAYWIKLQEAIAAVRRVFFFLDYESEEDRTGGKVLTDVVEGVRFEGVTFAYPDNPPALVDIDLELTVGEFVAIVGPTGAGKTTLAQLVPGLLAPTSGRVLIDGIDAATIDLHSLRGQVSYVFQEHFLLSESIRENLLLANPEASSEQIEEALSTAGCMEFINELPAGIDTVLGRAGDTLSVGQQQRLSIARGLVRDTRILILDEPTAALDPVTESALVTALRTAAERRLVIVIAHRLSTIRNADRIVFLEGGRIREIGSHDDLMGDAGGAYRGFVEMQ